MEVTLNNLCYTYKTRLQTVHAVKDVTFTARSGEFCAIVGKSGSGKTTLLSLLAGLDKPTAGEILIDGVDLQKMDLDLYRRSQMSLIFQNYNLFPLMTAQENVAYPLILNKYSIADAMERAKEKLSLVGLGENYLRRLPAMLSGGEQQRVAIARALANHAKLVLADEPTGNLDVENSREVVMLLRELSHQQQCCVIVVTHDLEIAKVADRVLVMQDGRIAEEKI